MKRFRRCFLLLALLLLPAFAARAELSVHYISVEKGDAILVCCDGENMLIDGGYKKYYDRMDAYLRKQNITSLKYYVASHGHPDHVQSAGAFISLYHPQAILCSYPEAVERILSYTQEKFPRTPYYEMVKATPVCIPKPGDTFMLGGAEIQVLGPITVYRGLTGRTAGEYKLENVNSLVLKLTYGENTFLFPGDARYPGLRETMERFPGALDVDVYKNAHHDTEMMQDVLDAIDPEICVFTTSLAAAPAKQYLRKLKKNGTRLYMTCDAVSGTVVVRSDGKNLSVSGDKKGRKLTLEQKKLVMIPKETAALHVLPDTCVFFADITFTSDDPSVASVDEEGVVTAHAAGTTVIRVKAENFNLNEAVPVTVEDRSVTFKKKEITLKGTEEKKPTMTGVSAGMAIRLESSDPAIAFVTEKGAVKGVGEGTCEVSAWLGDRCLDTCRVHVKDIALKSVKIKGASSVRVSRSVKLSVSTKPAKALYRECVWTSSDTAVAEVDENGVVTGISTGKAKITCCVDGKNASKTIKVNAPKGQAYNIVPFVTTIYPNCGEYRFYAVTDYRYPESVPVQWSSSKPSVATIDENGVVTPISAGKTSIIAKGMVGDVQKKIKVTVKENEFTRKSAVSKKGKAHMSAKRMRYEGDMLLVEMYVYNRTGQPYTVPEGAVLTFKMPTGQLRKIETRFTQVGMPVPKNATAVVTIAFPLQEYPYLKDLALPKCDLTT